MGPPDMSAGAVTARLLRTAQLRRLCLVLNRREGPGPQPGSGDPAQPPASASAGPGRAPARESE